MEVVARFKSFSALFILMAAAMIAQSGATPEWGENLLSCGFTHALRTISRSRRQHPHPTRGASLSNRTDR